MRRLMIPPIHVRHAVNAIAHLPLLARLLHPNSRRPLVVCGLGIVIMVSGSGIALQAHSLSLITGAPHLLIDTTGYLIHAIGTLPIVRYVDPVWTILIGAQNDD